jgi:hypothetical protein
MSSAIEVLKSKKSICDLCKYDNGKSCDASGGEFNECKPADDFYKAIQEAIVALEKQENYVIDFIRLEVFPKSKKEQFRVFFKDGSEQVFEKKKGW